MRTLLVLATIAIALVVTDLAPADQATQLQPIHLRVGGCEGAWCADNEFRLDWDRPPIASEGYPVTAVHFRVRDSAGTLVVPETELPGDVTYIERIHVSAVPGIYTADVRLEGPDDELGPWISAALRFDNVPPHAVQPLAPAQWVAGNAGAAVRIEHPAGPLPVSGIRGYAYTVDRGGGSLPCAAPDRCSVAETDLRGGLGDDIISLGTLPEGVNIVRVLAVSGSGVSSATPGSAIVRVDATRPKVDLAGAPGAWADGPVRLVARAADTLSGMAADGPGGPYTAIAVDGALPRMEAGDSAAAMVAGDGTHRVAAFARDAAGNASDGSPATVTVSIDERPPAVAFARAQDPSEPERLEAAVADPLSGPSTMRGSIAVRPAGSSQRWQPLPTAVGPGRLVARWDSDSFPAGTYEFRATGYDAAGNGTSSERRGNGTRMILTNPLKASTRIEAGLGGGRATARSVRYGHGARYGGKLSLASGSPLAGMQVRIVEVFDVGSDSAQRVTSVQTAADGTFQTQLPPGPSRQVETLFAGNRILGRSSGGRARLEVSAGVRLRASASIARIGGGPVIFSGRLGDLGTRLPPGGRPVELQFRLGRGRWLEFRTVQADARGRFRYAYSFSDDDSRGVRFQFRAYAAGGDWPYEPAASKPVIVTGS